MKEHHIAVYIRLSMADEDTAGSRKESNSVSNQRKLIHQFLDKHPELSGYPRSEFCDDGFTGTNMDRPSFQKMMAKVKKGEIDLICVKDFSRFSRDYIEIGDCLECLFPFLGVRFLSVNDGYDSADYMGTTGGMEVVMRNIIYAAYSKDLSIKTTSAKIQRMKQGQYMGGFAPYGFVFHPTQRNRLAADPEAAPVVRRIFALAIKGVSPSEIARTLNRDGVPTPGQYFVGKHPDKKKFSQMSRQVAWSYEMVHRILTKRAYTGAAVGHVRKIAAPLSRKTVKQDEVDWIVVEGAHEAIVSAEDFELAQTVIHKAKYKKGKAELYPLRSLVRCGNCGRVMYHNKGGTFYCSYGRTSGDEGCSPAVKYSEKELEEIAYQAIRMLLNAASEDEQKKKVKSREISKTRRKLAVSAGLQRESETLKKQRLVLYEQFSGGEISKTAYLERKAVLDERLDAIRTELAKSEEETAMQKDSAPFQTTGFESEAKGYLGETSLTWEMAHAFIQAIYVYPDGRREIRWKFRDIAT